VVYLVIGRCIGKWFILWYRRKGHYGEQTSFWRQISWPLRLLNLLVDTIMNLMLKKKNN